MLNALIYYFYAKHLLFVSSVYHSGVRYNRGIRKTRI